MAVISVVFYAVELFRSIQSISERCECLEKELKLTQEKHAYIMASMNNRLEEELRRAKEKYSGKIASLSEDLKRNQASLEAVLSTAKKADEKIAEIEGVSSQLKKRFSETEEKMQQNREFAALLQEILSPIEAKKINKQISEIHESIDMIHKRIMSSEEFHANSAHDIHDCMNMLADRVIKLEDKRYGTRLGIFQNY